MLSQHAEAHVADDFLPSKEQFRKDSASQDLNSALTSRSLFTEEALLQSASPVAHPWDETAESRLEGREVYPTVGAVWPLCSADTGEKLRFKCSTNLPKGVSHCW